MENDKEPIPIGFDIKNVMSKEGNYLTVYAKAHREDKLHVQALFPQAGILVALVTIAFRQISKDLKDLGLNHYTEENQQKAIEYVRAKFPEAFRDTNPQID